MDNKHLATRIHAFLAHYEPAALGESKSSATAIEIIKDNLTRVATVEETMKGIEEISDYFESHYEFLAKARPLLNSLTILRRELEGEERKRMVSDTGYEVKHAIHIGDKEILFAVNEKAENGMFYFVGYYTHNDIIGQYDNCEISDDYLEAMGEFNSRVAHQLEIVRQEIQGSGLPTELFTAEHCDLDNNAQSIYGKIVVLRADIFRPEYRRGDVQLVLVTGGSGARPNPSSRSIYCIHLNRQGNEKETRFYRSDVLGIIKPECLPAWARERAVALLAEKKTSQKPSDRGER
jgi:hypothetical protein